MGFGQTMITVAFLVLLTLAVVNANKMIVDKEASYYEAMATEEGSFLANNLMNEILSKRFDENASTGVGSDTLYQLPSAFTPTANFGFYDDGGTWNEFISVYFYNSNVSNPITYPYDWKTSIPFSSMLYFDDVDDYNGYYRYADPNISSNGTRYGDTLSVAVHYVDPSNPTVTLVSRTYLKRIDITVQNEKYFKNKIKLKFSSTKPYTF